MQKDKWFWLAGIEDIEEGYLYDTEEETYHCLVCGKEFIDGRIYEEEGKLYEAKKAIKGHINKEHGGMFTYLLGMSKKYTGLTDTQNQLLKDFYEGLSDKDIISKQGSGSTSTIRNHRFRLKEREKQAKIFLAIMGLLNKNKKYKKREEFVHIHKGATMVDDRYAITPLEREKVIKNYFIDGGEKRLINFPSKEKRKIIVLQEITKVLDKERRYNEGEINEILKKFFDDYVTLRRYLIEYGFMERSNDGSDYWVKD